MPDQDMAAYWDARARENAAYFVENRLDYSDTDLERFWATGPEVVDKVLGLLDLRIGPHEELVELGCGLGRLTRVLADRGRSVRALDISGEMLARAREMNPQLANVEWLQCDGRSLNGVADASADGFFSHVVLQHVPDPAITYAYVEDMGRVLRPGGWAAFQVSNDPGVHQRLGPRARLRHRMREILRLGPKGTDHPAWRGSAVQLEELRAAAERGGTEIERISGENTQFCLVRLRRVA